MLAWFSFVRIPLASSSLTLQLEKLCVERRSRFICHLTCYQQTLMLRILGKSSCIFCLFKELFIMENFVHKSSKYKESSCIDYDCPALTSLSMWPVLPHLYLNTPSTAHLSTTVSESNLRHIICKCLYYLKGL